MKNKVIEWLLGSLLVGLLSIVIWQVLMKKYGLVP